MELQSQVETLRTQGVGLAAISYDPPETLARFAERYEVTFPLLSDVGSDVITRYGVRNTVAEVETLDGVDPIVEEQFRQYVSVTSPSPRFNGMAFPGTFVLDPEGRVTARHFEDFYRERSTVASILLRVGEDGPSVEATQVSTEHLELTTYPSDTTVALGNRLALVLDVAPGPDMHVYAPGATGYRVIGLSLTPPPFVRVFPMQFPESEIYHFVPLDEHVPVYQEPFRLLQEVVPEASREAIQSFEGQDSLTLTGSLEYQACDDTLCYNPTSIPLSWTVALRPYAASANR